MWMKWLRLGVLGALSLASACMAGSGTLSERAGSAPTYRAKTVVEGIDVPWAMVQLDNRDLLVTDRKGRLRIVREGQLLAQEISGLPPLVAAGQGGLLDIALHPNYSDNGWLYVTLTSAQGAGAGTNTALYRAKFDAAALTLYAVEQLYKGADNTPSNHHFGSRIAFDLDNYVYFSIGDRGARAIKPQSLSIDGGKIYRLHDDGRIPADNPFVAQADARPAIYSYGHRNPQGLARHPRTGAIWSHEHGPRGGDEVNIIEKGQNYGWPLVSYGVNYDGSVLTSRTQAAGMVSPIWYWVPSIAPSDMVFVTSERYPQWQGKLLVGSLKFQHLVLLDLSGDKVTGQTTLFEGVGRVRSVLQGRDGYLYFSVDGGRIMRIEP